ncbi:MAG: metallopeptidase TldD-related protein [Nanoarchaeota archaeon]
MHEVVLAAAQETIEDETRERRLGQASNRLRHRPRIRDLEAYHLTTRSAPWVAINGGFTESPGKVCETASLLVRAHVGGAEKPYGGKSMYITEAASPNTDRRNLDSIGFTLTQMINSASALAMGEYVKAIQQELLRGGHLLDHLYPVDPVVDLLPVRKGYFKVERMIHVITRASSILRDHPSVLHTMVKVDHTDQVLRGATSNGTCIREQSLGFRVGFYVVVAADPGPLESRDGGYRVMRLEDALYTTDPNAFNDSQFRAQVTQRARMLLEESVRRLSRDSCPDIVPEPGALVLTSHDATCSRMHEALFGHLLCANLITDGQMPYALSRFGTQVLDERLSIVSDPTMVDDREFPLGGSYSYDAECVPAKRKTLIDQGVWRDVQASRASAQRGNMLLARMGKAPVFTPGDARISMFSHEKPAEPFERVSNIDIQYHENGQPKTWKGMVKRFLDELRSRGLPYGYILNGSTDGIVSGDGSFYQDYLFPQRIWADGRIEPMSPIREVSQANTLYNDLVLMGGGKRYFTHRCGLILDETRKVMRVNPSFIELSHDEADPNLIRTCVFTPAAIWQNISLQPVQYPVVRNLRLIG